MQDPRLIIARSPMGRAQIIAIALAFLLNALDGFDILSISFAAPGIASEWGIDRGALGVVLSMELLGMSIGSILIGHLADRKGRRPIVLGCLVLMVAGMFLAATAQSVLQLSVYRLITGLGIGGMLAATNAITAEFSNFKRRHLTVALMACGYPVGAAAGGLVASQLLVANDWRSVFMFGGVATLIVLPLVWYRLPETISFLVTRRPPNALEKVNATLRRLQHPPIDVLPPQVTDTQSLAATRLFAPELATTVLLFTLAYFMHLITFYFIMKWTPKIIVDMGFAASAAGRVLVWSNIGGVAGSLLFSFLTQVVRIRPLLIVTMFLSTAFVWLFGNSPGDLSRLATIAAIAGFCTNAVIVGLYAMLAQSLPAAVRASGTGFVIGIGRGGAVISPIAAGFLFSAGWSLGDVATIMAAGSLVGAVAVLVLKFDLEREAA